MGLTATLTHMLLWNFNDIKAGWAWAAPSNLKKLFMADTWMFWKKTETPEQRNTRKQNDPALDPHYKLMMRNLYKETPMWWWGAVVLSSWVVGIACLYSMKVSILLRAVSSILRYALRVCTLAILRQGFVYSRLTR